MTRPFQPTAPFPPIGCTLIAGPVRGAGADAQDMAPKPLSRGQAPGLLTASGATKSRSIRWRSAPLFAADEAGWQPRLIR